MAVGGARLEAVRTIVDFAPFIREPKAAGRWLAGHDGGIHAARLSWHPSDRRGA
ncbi:hypothetical protein SAMN07250955_102326 [Arboricoccus pini]|uniref:Uncharacterized protein n=1 Tax=Arboricoccus pini TaxID=1963835 RepID=A0A212QQE3_9PROT|nr:hypothetical protein SAMN07250955_102326 [Arboricoccus pini]